MAEIARLGMAIDATGVSEMRQELQAMARTAAEAARSFETAGGAVERSGDKIGNAAGGFFEFDQGAQRADRSIKPLAKSIAGATVAMLDLGPAGNAAANAIQSMLNGVGPLAIGMGAISLAVYFLNFRLEAARENLRILAEQDFAKLQQATENLKLDQSFRQELKVLESLDPAIESVRQKHELAAIAAEKNGASQDTLARIARISSLEQKKILDERLAGIAKEQQAIQGQISAADFRIAKIGATGDALAQLNLEEQRYNLSQDETLKKHTVLAAVLDRRITQEANLQRAQSFIQTGRQATVGFQDFFGQTFDFEKQLSGFNLADKFSAIFETFKNDRNAAGQLQGAFGHLISEAVRIGAPDIPELLSQKLGAANFSRLRETLDDDLKSTLDTTSQAGQQWGSVFEGEFQKFTARGAEVGVRMDEIAAKMRKLENAVTQDLAMQLDVSQPLSAVQSVQAQIDALRNTPPIPIMIQTYASGSPTLEFSDYFNNYVPSQLAKISDIQPRIEILTRQMGEQGFDPLGKQNRLSIVEQISGLVAQREDLRAELARDVSTAQQQGGGSGGGGGMSVVLDFSGATFNGATIGEVLDNEILPRLEREALRLTGKELASTQIYS